MAERKRIGVDIDDVLSETVDGLVAFCNERWNMGLRPEDYTEEWAVFFGLPIDETLARIDVILQTGIYGRLAHVQKAVPVLTRLATRHDLVALTSRRSILKPETDLWVPEHFPGIFQGIYYTGFWDEGHHIPTALAATKSELCQQLELDALIDDMTKHCIGAASVGTEGLLYGEYKWNETAEPLPQGVTRVRDWDAVEEYFNAQG